MYLSAPTNADYSPHFYTAVDHSGGIHPLYGSNDKIRKKHLHEAMMEVARLVRDLLTIVPIAFLKGAVVGPMWIVSTFAFGTALMSIGGSVATTMGTVAVVGGAATAVLSAIPAVTEHVKQVWMHLKWVRNPRKMASEEVKLHTRYHTRIATLAVLAAACMMMMWPVVRKDLSSFRKRMTGLDLNKTVTEF